jgi:hypothetical protein
MDRTKFAVGDDCLYCDKKGTFKEATGKDAADVMKKIGHEGKEPPAGMIIKCSNKKCKKIVLSRDPYRAFVGAQ